MRILSHTVSNVLSCTIVLSRKIRPERGIWGENMLYQIYPRKALFASVGTSE